MLHEFKQLKHAQKVLQSENKYRWGIVMTTSFQLQHTFKTNLQHSIFDIMKQKKQQFVSL